MTSSHSNYLLEVVNKDLQDLLNEESDKTMELKKEVSVLGENLLERDEALKKVKAERDDARAELNSQYEELGELQDNVAKLEGIILKLKGVEAPFPFNDAMGRPIVLVLEDPAPVEEEEEEEVEEDQDPKLTELGIMHNKLPTGKYQLYNPKTQRWIGNDAGNRRRICRVNNELA